MTEIERVVKGLTPAMREAIIGARDLMSSHGGYPFFMVDFDGDPWPKGVAQFLTLKSDRLTPLGLAVRDYLINESTDNGK